DTTVFALEGAGRTGFATVPRPYLAGFLRKLDAGLLDTPIAAFLAAPATGTRPASWAEATQPALFDTIRSGSQIVPPHIRGRAAARPPAARVTRRRGSVSPPLFIGIGVVAVVIAIIGIFVLGGSGQPVAVTGSPTPPVIVEPTPTSFIVETPTPAPPASPTE